MFAKSRIIIFYYFKYLVVGYFIWAVIFQYPRVRCVAPGLLQPATTRFGLAIYGLCYKFKITVYLLLGLSYNINFVISLDK